MSLIDQASANSICNQLSVLINGMAYRLARLREDESADVDRIAFETRETAALLANLRVLRNDFENICAGLPK